MSNIILEPVVCNHSNEAGDGKCYAVEIKQLPCCWFKNFDTAKEAQDYINNELKDNILFIIIDWMNNKR